MTEGPATCRPLALQGPSRDRHPSTNARYRRIVGRVRAPALVSQIALLAVTFSLVGANGTPAIAGCASAVVVEGRVLFGASLPRKAATRHLPRPGRPHEAIRPGCNDTGDHESDVRASVLTLEGLPPTVAVVDRQVETLYVAPGALTASSAHPLHRVLRGRPDRPARCRPRPGSARAIVRSALPTNAIESGGRYIGVDAATRLVNRPALTPLLPGQRLRIGAAACGRRIVARRIRLVGPPPRLRLYEPQSGPGGASAPLAAAAALGAAAILVVGYGIAAPGRRRRRARRSGSRDVM